MDFIVLFLREYILLEDKSEVDKVRRKMPRFWLSEDQKIYKRSFSGSYLLYIHPETSELLLEELHEGICGSHIGGRSLSHRVITQGYWWPNMQKKQKSMWRSVINVKYLHETYTNQEESLIPYPALGHLHSGACILLSLSPKQQVTRDICWSAQTISLNGLKLSPWRISEMWMPRIFSGKTSLPGSGSFIPSSQIMDFSSIANPSRDTAVNWELRTGIPLQPTPRGMDKLRLLIRS